MSAPVFISGPWDDFRSRQIRFLEEASKLGPVDVLLWSDALVRQLQGKEPNFPESERRYVLQSLRFVNQVKLVENLSSPDALPETVGASGAGVWVVDQAQDSAAKRHFCDRHGLRLHLLSNQALHGFPLQPAQAGVSGRKKVIVTGCYDWLHSGHVRFFEEVSEHGDLYVVLGHDANIRILKGEGHPLFPEAERRYLVGAVRFVTQALVATGDGWLDAEPEIEKIKPDIYAVNEDGDKGGKREFCAAHGIDYLVLKRKPAPGLPRRSSTGLRGF